MQTEPLRCVGLLLFFTWHDSQVVVSDSVGGDDLNPMLTLPIANIFVDAE